MPELAATATFNQPRKWDFLTPGTLRATWSNRQLIRELQKKLREPQQSTIFEHWRDMIEVNFQSNDPQTT